MIQSKAVKLFIISLLGSFTTYAQVGIGTTDPKSTFEVQGSVGYKVSTITSATTLNDTYHVVLCNNGPYTVTLPTAASNSGRVYKIKNIDAQSDAITIDANGSETIDGALTYNLQPYKHSVTIISDGTNWHTIEDNSVFTGGVASLLTCSSATNNGTLVSGVAASSVSSDIPYTGGNGGAHGGQTVTSTGVTGLTATLSSGTFASGAGTLTYTITGTPASSGTASFAISIGGQTCTLTRTVNAAGPTYPDGSVHCISGGATITEVTNGITGKTWMDRNLGATQVATSSTDANSYGDFYQWGRFSDGHQCTTSSTTATLSATDTPGHANFILAPSTPFDWRSTQNDNLWQGVSGTNNPCPSGYRLPTQAEFDAERATWGSLDAAGGFASALKLPASGFRLYTTGAMSSQGTIGRYWTSTVSSSPATSSQLLQFGSTVVYVRNGGFNVRCIKN